MVNAKKQQLGFSVLELVVSMGIGATILGAMLLEFSALTSNSYNQQIREATYLRAQSVLQSMSSDLRLLGNGVPFDQPNFQIGEASLSNSTFTEPVLVSLATSSSVTFLLNETGKVQVATTDFTPTVGSAVSRLLYLTDLDGISVGDLIYISNFTVGGDDGFAGTVQAMNVADKVVLFNSLFIATPGATFEAGSIAENVSVVTYDSPSDGSGVTRNNGSGASLMAPNSTFVLDYLDENGNSLTLPLTQATLTDSLRMIDVTVNVTSSDQLSDGSNFSASVTQRVGLRNLNYVF